MSLKRHWPLLFAIIALICAFGWPSLGQKTRSSEKAWEYKIVTEWYGDGNMRRDLPLNAKDISGYGARGWELVSIVPQDNGEGKIFYFKRPK